MLFGAGVGDASDGGVDSEQSHGSVNVYATLIPTTFVSPH